MDAPTQIALRFVVDELAVAGVLSPENIASICEKLKNAAADAFRSNYDVDARQMQNIAADLNADVGQRRLQG